MALRLSEGLAAGLLLFAVSISSARSGPDPLTERLETTKVTFELRDCPARRAARHLGQVAGVDLVLDPPLRDRTVTLRAEDESAWTVVGRLSGLLEARWDLRWGAVLVATPERLEDLPEALSGELEALDAPVTLDLEAVPLRAVLDLVATRFELRVDVDPTIAERVDGTTVDVNAREAPVRDVLCRILYPAGFGVEVRAETVRVLPAPIGREPWREKVEQTLSGPTMSVSWQDADLSRVLGLLGTYAGFPVVLDPAVPGPSDRAAPKVTLEVSGITIGDALRGILEPLSLAFDVRWGGLFVATPRRLREVPTVLLSGMEARAFMRELGGRLDQDVVLGNATSLLPVLRGIAATGGVDLVFDPDAEEVARTTVFRGGASAVPLRHALEMVLLPAGLTARLDEGRLRVSMAR